MEKKGRNSRFEAWAEQTLAHPVSLAGIWLGFSLVVVLQIFGPTLTSVAPGRLSFAGQFGDAFGALSSLMATLAAFGAWRAVRLQRDDAREARIRAFNDTFFTMLGQLNAIVNSTDISVRREGEQLEREGRDAFRSMLTSLRKSVPPQKSGKSSTGDITCQTISKAYINFYHRKENDLGHYFRTVYQICRYIHESYDIDKTFYFRFLRSQLSNSEQILIMYNCAFGYGFKRFKPLVEQYSLVHNLRFPSEGSVWEESLIKGEFETGAFENEGGEDDLPVFEFDCRLGEEKESLQDQGDR